MRRACATILDRAAGVPYLDYVKHVDGHPPGWGPMIVAGGPLPDEQRVTLASLDDAREAYRRGEISADVLASAIVMFGDEP